MDISPEAIKNLVTAVIVFLPFAICGSILIGRAFSKKYRIIYRPYISQYVIQKLHTRPYIQYLDIDDETYDTLHYAKSALAARVSTDNYRKELSKNKNKYKVVYRGNGKDIHY